MTEKKIKGRLTTKVLVILILSSLLIGLSCGTVGYLIFSRVIERMYYNDTNQLGEMVVNYLYVNNLESALDELKKSESTERRGRIIELIDENQDYKELQRFLRDLKDSTNVSEITIADYKDTDGSISETFYYFAGVRGETDELQLISVGETGEVTNLDNAITEIYETKVPSEHYIIIKDDSGEPEMVSLQPILSDNREVIAVVTVKEPMVFLTSTLKEFLISVLIYSAIITIVIIEIFILLNKRILIKPIEKMTHATSNFIQNNVSAQKELGTIQTHDEIQLLAESIIKMEMDIKNYIDNIQKITSEKERVDTELKVATSIQKGMLPNTFPKDKVFDIFATMKPAKEVGGDYYDLFMIDDDHLAFGIGDVSGKGVPAALFMAITKTLIQDQALEGKSPAEIFTTVNEKLIANNSSDMFVTAWFGILELSSGTLTFVNAGHNPPFIRNGQGFFEMLKTKPGLVLGGLDGIKYKEQIIKLEPGSELFLYTDGVTEAQDIEDVLYGEERLEEVLNRNRDTKVENLLSKIKEDVDTFVIEAEQFDDITMLAVKFNEYKEDKND